MKPLTQTEPQPQKEPQPPKEPRFKKEPDDPFADIRPYQDHEIRPVLNKLIHNPEFLDTIAGFYHPRLSRLAGPLMRLIASLRLRRQLQRVRDVQTMQVIIAEYIDRMIAETSSGLSSSGLDRLSPRRNYVFMCNHRDIALDPALVNYMLHRGGHATQQIAIGDNLLTRPFVSDLMRLNKSFIVRRSLKGRELLRSLKVLSRYIHHCIESGENVWIAQREGRAKDGIDRTDPALLKMLSMHRRDLGLGASLERLHIVPVSISYEFDACDGMKAEERYQTETAGGFSKTERSDIEAIVAGVTGFKGRIHVAFGTELEIDGDDPERIAEGIDAQIIGNYRLYDVNFAALEMLLKRRLLPPDAAEAIEPHRREPTQEARQALLDRLRAVKPERRPYLLFNYANPVLSRQRIQEPSAGMS